SPCCRSATGSATTGSAWARSSPCPATTTRRRRRSTSATTWGRRPSSSATPPSRSSRRLLRSRPRASLVRSGR
ncbi:MAG: hypothetical protein GEV10_25895, partial [Streptosporangiales bacterium]|nr:hypothetical protein [Streptosporangiales bacterium]